MQLLTPKAIEGYSQSLNYEAHILIRTLIDDGRSGTIPVNPHHYAGRYALKYVSTLPLNTIIFDDQYSNMLLISFGIRTDNIEDPLIARALHLAMEFMDLTGKQLYWLYSFLPPSDLDSHGCAKLTRCTGPWSNPIDFFEPLQWIPSNMRTRGRKLHQDLIEVYGAMILLVKAKLDAGEFVPDCLVKTLIQDQAKENLDWEDLCMLSAVFTLGGVHSVSN